MLGAVEAEDTDEPGGSSHISVVIPFFNSSDRLPRALASVIAQSTPVGEIIVVDDASSVAEHDHAWRILSAIPQARLVTLEVNVGPGEARNAGWDDASGMWVAFLDSDDAWHPRKLEYQLRAAARSVSEPALIACRWTQARTIDEYNVLPIPADPPVRSIDKWALLLKNRMSTPSVMVRRDLPVRFPLGRRYGEDYELWLLIAGLGRPILRVEAPLCALFKAPYGESGLSAALGPMMRGEYNAVMGAYRAHAMHLAELILALAAVTARTALRIVKLARRCLEARRG